jgi:hypothetical protein
MEALIAEDMVRSETSDAVTRHIHFDLVNAIAVT